MVRWLRQRSSRRVALGGARLHALSFAQPLHADVPSLPVQHPVSQTPGLQQLPQGGPGQGLLVVLPGLGQSQLLVQIV